jgi:hypothetical protein
MPQSSNSMHISIHSKTHMCISRTRLQNLYLVYTIFYRRSVICIEESTKVIVLAIDSYSVDRMFKPSVNG